MYSSDLPAPAGATPGDGAAPAAREALIRARLATLADIETASVELGRHRIAPSLAHDLAHDLVVASAIPAVADLTGDRGLVPELDDAALAELDRLTARFGGTIPAVAPEAREGAFIGPILRAHARLGRSGG